MTRSALQPFPLREAIHGDVVHCPGYSNHWLVGDPCDDEGGVRVDELTDFGGLGDHYGVSGDTLVEAVRLKFVRPAFTAARAMEARARHLGESFHGTSAPSDRGAFRDRMEWDR